MRSFLMCALLFAGGSLSCLGAEAPIKAEEIELFRARLNLYKKWNEVNEKDAQRLGNAKQAEKRLKEQDMRGLRYLLILERDLAVLASGEIKLVEADEDAGIPRSDKGSVPKLRQQIRDAERQMIRVDLRFIADANGLVDLDEQKRHAGKLDSSEKAILSLEIRLDTRFERIGQRLDRETKRIGKQLQRESDARRPDEKKIEEVRKEFELAKQKKANVTDFYFGPQLNTGGRAVRGLPVSEDAGARQLLSEIRAMQGQLVKVLRGEIARPDVGNKKEATIGGTNVFSANLGVLLDVSPSMRGYIAGLKKEIAKNFETPHYQEVLGCQLNGQILSLDVNRTSAHLSHDSMIAIEKLIVVDRVDTVYWFCDLMDGYDFSALRRLRQLSRSHDVAFHIKSIGKRPDRYLEQLVAKP